MIQAIAFEGGDCVCEDGIAIELEEWSTDSAHSVVMSVYSDPIAIQVVNDNLIQVTLDKQLRRMAYLIRN